MNTLLNSLIAADLIRHKNQVMSLQCKEIFWVTSQLGYPIADRRLLIINQLYQNEILHFGMKAPLSRRVQYSTLATFQEYQSKRIKPVRNTAQEYLKSFNIHACAICSDGIYIQQIFAYTILSPPKSTFLQRILARELITCIYSILMRKLQKGKCFR